MVTTIEQQYILTKQYGDGSRGRSVVTWAEIQKMPAPGRSRSGLTITIEEL